MNSNRKCIWILTLMLAVPALAAGGATAAYQGGGYGGGAGAGPGGGERREPMSPDERVKQMTKNFNLSADQQAKIKPILVDERKRMEEMRTDSSGDRQAMRQKMMQIRQDTNDQIRAQLDDKQKEKFDRQEKEREERMQHRRDGRPGGDS